MARATKKKRSDRLKRTASDLGIIVVYYRQVFIAVFLLVLVITAQQSATKPKQPLAAYPELSAKLMPKQEPPARAPDSSPRTAKPLLMPWRGPVEPVPATPGAAAVIYEIPTTDPVIFVTIDDGLTQDPAIAEWLASRRLPFSLFLDNDAIKNNYAYFERLKLAGMSVQNHTMSHPPLPKLTLDGQRAEICAAADTFASVYGKRPTLLRPPYGTYDELTRQAAFECGMRAIVMWRAVVENGVIYFQTPEARLNAGDIVLLHFKPNLIADLEALTVQAQKDHLRVGRLEDWIK